MVDDLQRKLDKDLTVRRGDPIRRRRRQGTGFRPAGLRAGLAAAKLPRAARLPLAALLLATAAAAPGAGAGQGSSGEADPVSGGGQGPRVTAVGLRDVDDGEETVHILGDAILVDVVFDQPVSVVVEEAGELPTISLRVGDRVVGAGYEEGSGSERLTFRHVVAHGDMDDDGVGVVEDSLRGDGSAIAGAGGIEAVLAHKGLGSDPNHRVDGVPPELEEAAAITVGEDWVALRFSEALDEDLVPSSAAYRVLVDGNLHAVTGSSTAGETVRLAIDPPLFGPVGEVEVAYSGSGGEGEIRDVSGNAAADATWSWYATDAGTGSEPVGERAPPRPMTAPARERAFAAIGRALAEKRRRTPTERKLSSELLDAIRSGETQEVEVEIRADVTPELTTRIEELGGEVLSQVARHRAVRAMVPIGALESIAEINGVQTLTKAERGVTNPRRGEPAMRATPADAGDRMTMETVLVLDEAEGEVVRPRSALRGRSESTEAAVSSSATAGKTNTSEGDVAHQANVARTRHEVDGTGIGVGVISDGVDSLAARQATGDLPDRVTVLPGQAGSGDEGTAMLEIVHDLAPGADLYFAEGMSSIAEMAANVEALCDAGADVIVDDLTYFRAPAFQDGPVAQAVNAAVGKGCLYFSSAGNSGNLNDGTSGVWEGDFVAGAEFSVDGEVPGRAHDFGDGVYENVIEKDTEWVFTLRWSDPYGASANDYDLFLVDEAGEILDSSTTTQDGTQDPVELIRSGGFSNNHTNARLVVVKTSGSERYIRLDTHRGELAVATAGSTFGHAAAENTIGVAAVQATGSAFDGTESVRTYSSDGPRRIFYTAAGEPITAGNLSATGGRVLSKPDLAAADGVSTATPGFATFDGTSAAAPHAAAIAALILEARGGPAGFTPALARTALATGAHDIEATGTDRDAGRGLVMAPAAVGSVAVAEAERNGAPTVAKAIPDQGLVPGGDAVTFDLGTVFEDPDDDELTYVAVSDEVSRVTAEVAGSTLTLTPGSPGSTAVVVTATDPGGLSVSLVVAVVLELGAADYDTDDDGLIEVGTLAQLDAIRYDLDGDGVVDGTEWRTHAAAFPLAVLGMGCPASCEGFELSADLDFDTNGNGEADSGDTYWNGGSGWAPLGDFPESFEAVFEGNLRTIRNLYIDTSETHAALFGSVSWGGEIRRLGLLDVRVTGTGWAGALVSYNKGDIDRCHATGFVSGNANVGGLVAYSTRGVRHSYARVEVSGTGNHVGGLVGYSTSAVIGSYATGTVAGQGSGVGGLVGVSKWLIAHSFAAGDVTGEDAVGGLVGSSDRVFSSYATGRVAGRGSRQEMSLYTPYGGVGGLAGDVADSIKYSYATGPVTGQAAVGGLVGTVASGKRTYSSYWDVTTSGAGVGVGSDDADDNGALGGSEQATGGVAGHTTSALQQPTDATGPYGSWREEVYRDLSTDAWHFGTDAEYPVLSVDFDGDGTATWEEFGFQIRDVPGPLTGSTTAGGRSVSLAWNAVDASHWSPQPGVRYTVTRAETDGGAVQTLASRVAATTYTDTGASGTSYIYQVAAVLDGTGTRSGRTTVVAGASNQPPAAVGVLADLSLRAGSGVSVVDVSGAFADPDGDTLSYSASTGESAVAATASGASVSVTPLSEGAAVVAVTATDGAGSNGSATQRFRVTVWAEDAVDYDADDDGLIEIRTHAQLDAVRHDLDGDGYPSETEAATYATAFPDAIGRMGCQGIDGCSGYELTADLDLDTNGNGVADAGDAYWNGSAGWAPVGGAGSFLRGGGRYLRNPFRTVFEGNGHTVSNLYVRTDGFPAAGLFGVVKEKAAIRNLGVVNVDVGGKGDVGAVAGSNHGDLVRTYATGRAQGTAATAHVGGMVGWNHGELVQSYAAVRVAGEVHVGGGLAGINHGDISASYATGSVVGLTAAGALVGKNWGSVAASYSTSWLPHRNVGRAVGVRYGRGTVQDSYFDTRTGGTGQADRSGRTTAELQEPTDYSGPFANWNMDIDGDDAADDPWDFGTATEYPALSVDFNGDGRETWQEFGYQIRNGPTLNANAEADGVALGWTAADVSHWTPAPGVVYAIEREAGGTVTSIAAGVTGLAHKDASVSADTTYVYRIGAVVNGGDGAGSAPASVRVDTITDTTAPTVTSMTSGASHPTKDPFDVDIEFSEPVSGLTIGELTVDRGTAADLTGSGTSYSVDVTPDSDLEGDVTVSVPAGVAEDAARNGNEAGSASFAVDTKAPLLLRAEADGTVLKLTWSEMLDPTSVPAAGAFSVSGERNVVAVDVQSAAVNLTVSSMAAYGEQLTVDYTVPAGATANPLCDTVGNDAASIANAAVTVIRGASPSSDATLGALALSGVDIGAFASATTVYGASVGNDVESTTVTATPSHAGAGVEIEPADADGGRDGHQAALGVGETVVRATVTAEDGTTTETYTVTVTRAASDDATLAGLALSGVDFGTFAAGTRSYAAEVAHEVESTTVTATPNDDNAVLEIAPPDADAETAGHQVALAVGETEVVAAVTAADGETVETYSVVVTRAPSDDASLSGLVLSGVDIGNFAGDTTSYAANVAHAVELTTATATPSDGNASVEIAPGDADAETAGHQVALAVGGNEIAATVTAENGETTRTYTVNVSRRKSDDASLSGLALSGVDFGGFAGGTTSYAAEVAHELESTTVAATASHEDAEVEITPLDVDAETTGHQVSLAVGETTVVAAVTAADGESTRTYKVAVTRAASDDASLSGLALSGIDIGTFAAGTTSYAASVGHAVESTTVAAAPSDENASVAIAPADADAEAAGHQVSLAVGETEVAATVTAEDGETTETYKVTVTRAASDDASLSGLALSGIDIGTFAAGTTSYAASVGHAVESTTVTATASDEEAGIAITPADSDGTAPGHQVALAVGETTVGVEVTAEDGETTRTYTVAVTRSPSDDASLSGLALSAVDFGAFAGGTTSYSANVAHDVESTTVTATPSDENAGVEVAPPDADAETAGHQVSLAVGDNEIAATVTAEDGETTETYTVAVTRPPSDDASLSGLALSGVDIGAFAGGTMSYTAEVAHEVESTTATATPSDENAGVEIAPPDADAETAGHQVALAVGGNEIAATVTAENGETTRTYTVNVSRRKSDDASLSGLALSGVDFGGFAGGTMSYAAEVAHELESTTVAATASHEDAEVEITPLDVDAEATGHQVSLAVGETTVVAAVTAADGESTRTYKVAVTRAASDDASLSGLALSGIDIGTFAAGTTSYAASVGHAVESTTVAAAPSDENASVAIAPADADAETAGHQVSLAVGETEVAATVTAEDGETTETYKVTVTRAASDDASLSGLALSGIDIGTFAAGTTSYAASVGHAVESTTVAAAPGDENAEVAIAPADADAETAGHQVSLSVGETAVAVEVTAEDGETTETYKVTVTRAASDDASLSGLALSGIDIGTFAAGTTSYAAGVGHAVESTTVTATAGDENAEVSIAPADGDAETGGHQVSLAVGETEVAATVTAEDGETTRIYTVTVTRAKSDDATLAALSLSDVDFGAFASDTTSYSAQVENVVESTTVTATASHADAELEFAPADADAETVGHQVSLSVGDTAIVVEVTAADGKATETYTVTVSRSKSDDAALRSLALSDVDIGAFDAETLEYAGTTEAESTTVAAEPNHAEASVTVAGATRNDDGDWSVSLDEGGNEIAVEVTAEDGGTTRTYAVSVRRAPAGTAVCRDGTALADPEDNPDLVRDCETLLSLKDELDPTGDMVWGDHPWYERLDLGDWDAVTVRDGRVREISWYGPDSAIRLYDGVLPAALGDLDALEVLRLDEQPLGGGLPETLRRLARLEVLDLAGNWKMDAEPLPAWLGELTSLRRVRLYAHAPGPVPDEWSALVRLEDLDLRAPSEATGTSGPIADWLGELPALRRLTLQSRQLTGRIPLSLAREFDYLNLNLNALTGCVPAQLAEAENARVSDQGSAAERYHLPDCALEVAVEGRDVEPSETVTLSAEASGHHEDATLAWSWTQADNGAPAVALSDADTATPSFTSVAERSVADVEFAFEVEVSDLEETSGSATATVVYRLAGLAGTAAPVVAGPESYEVGEGETAVAVLTATDADTAAEHLTWRLSGGADAPHFSLDARSATLAFAAAKDYEAPDDADGDGTYQVTVEASDGVQSGGADLAVVLANRNEAPTADAGEDQGKLKPGSTVTLAGSATDPDAGDTLTYAWTQVSGPAVALSSATAVETSFEAPAAGALTFRLRATDAAGLYAEDETTVRMLAWGDRLPEHDIELAGDAFLPGGMWSDGDTLWASSWYGDGEVRAFALDGTRRAGRDIAVDGNPMGLWSDGTTLWVADYDGGRLRAYRLSDGTALPDDDITSLEEAGNSRPTGLWSDGARLWTADYSSGGVYAYRLSDGSRDADAGFAFDVESLRATGLWSDGETALLADWRDGRLAARRLSDGARLPDLDIDTAAAGNGSPQGLWSADSLPENAAGETLPEDVLWVSDELESKLYAYAVPSADEDDAGGVAREPIPDAALAAALEAQGGGDPGTLTSLDLSDLGIADLTGIAAAEELRTLTVSGNAIVDLGPLSGLVALEELDIGGNLYLRNLAPLAPLQSLRVLRAADNAIADVAPLARLGSLVELDVSGNMIRDASPLAALGGLARLDIGDNAVADPTPLAGLADGAVLGLDDQLALAGSSPTAYFADGRLRAVVAAALGKARGEAVTEAELGLLTALDAPVPGIADLRDLGRATRLRALRLEGGRIADLWPLEELGGLRRLHLRGNAVRDVAAVSGLSGLRVLDLRGNAVADLRPLAELASLERLDLGGNPVGDLGALGELERLVWLRVPDVGSVPVDRLVRLRWLWRDGAVECLACPGRRGR